MIIKQNLFKEQAQLAVQLADESMREKGAAIVNSFANFEFAYAAKKESHET